jgi:CRP-like cAMP-binding protein
MPNDTFDYESPFPIYSYSKDFKDLIHDAATKVTYPANKSLVFPFDTDHHFFYVGKGRVRISIMSIEGKERIQSILGEDTFFGSVFIIKNFNDSVYITTETECDIYQFNKDVFWKLINTSELFRTTILDNLSNIYLAKVKELESHSFKTCRDRLYKMLTTSVDYNNPTDKGWYKLRVQYSQTDMAKIIGANRFTVTKLLHALRDEGLIRILNNKIEIKMD